MHPAAGISELNWDAIAKHLGRGKRSVQRKYDNLKGSLIHGPPGAAAWVPPWCHPGMRGCSPEAGRHAACAFQYVDHGTHACLLCHSLCRELHPSVGLGSPRAGAAPLPSNDGKKWSQDEVTELLLLVEDEGYRRQRMGLDKVRRDAWRVCQGCRQRCVLGARAAGGVACWEGRGWHVTGFPCQQRVAAAPPLMTSADSCCLFRWAGVPLASSLAPQPFAHSAQCMAAPSLPRWTGAPLASTLAAPTSRYPTSTRTSRTRGAQVGIV